MEYFGKSELAGTYSIKAEEKTSVYGNSSGQYQLIIDPLDGTSPFIKQQETWGTMIGLCDRTGILKYSWNMVANGNIYKTSDNPKKLKSFQEKLRLKEKIIIDVYDYKSGASDKFGSVFEKLSGVKTEQYSQTSYPAAVWTGWELFTGNLDGLLWVSSDKGKKFYPDYDLVFLGALSSIGFKIRLGKVDNNNAIIAIAPTDEDADLLYTAGLNLIPISQQESIRLAENFLQITN